MVPAPLPLRAKVDEAMERLGWEEITFDDYVPNSWSAIPDGVRVRSEGAVSIVFRPVTVGLEDTPRLRWRWRSDTASTATNLALDAGEDRIMSLLVAFPYQAERATFRESLLRSLVVAMRGANAPGRTISYTWGGDRPHGSLFHRQESPNTSGIRILRNSEDGAGVWYEETVDVAADFRELFGWEAPDPTFIGLSSDSDDTGVPFTAEIEGIEFVPR